MFIVSDGLNMLHKHMWKYPSSVLFHISLLLSPPSA